MTSAHDLNSERENLPTTGNPAGCWRLQYARWIVGVRTAHGVSAEARIQIACAAFFVTRAKRKLDCTCRSRHRVDKTTGLRSDPTIVLAGVKSGESFPDPLRRVTVYDTEQQRGFVFLTNNFTLPALTNAKF